MFKSFFVYTGAFVVVVIIAAVSCTRDAKSGPKYIFKKPPKQGVVAEVLGKEVSEAELFKGAENELYEAQMRLHELKMDQLRAYVLKSLMKSHPKRKNLSNDEFLNQVIARGVKVSEKDIAAFVKEKGIAKRNVTAGFKKRVRKFILKQKKRDAIDVWVARQTAKNPVKVYFAKPMPPVFEIDIKGAPFKGGVDAKVTVVKFSDFQCHYCRDGVTILNQLHKKYGNKIKIVFKQFPLSFHSQAKIAGRASLCAGDQEMRHFWRYHDTLFANQAKLSRPGLKFLAKELGLDTERFNRCLDSSKFADQVEQDLKDGRLVGVKATPTFFINGRIVRGIEPIEVFIKIVEEELAR